MASLRAFGEQRGWTPDKLTNWGARRFLLENPGVSQQPLARPPATYQQLWAHGATVSTSEHGIELHPAALALLDEEYGLRHQVWRGQSELLMPVLDRARLALCAHFTNHYGAEWPLYDPPVREEDYYAVQTSPLACEWNHLRHLVKHCSAMSGERQWEKLIDLGWNLRNDMAHFRPVNVIQYEMICRYLNEMVATLQRVYGERQQPPRAKF